MPYPEHPPAGRVRAKLLAEQINNVTKHFGWQARQKTSDLSVIDTVEVAESQSHSRRVFDLAWPMIGENFRKHC